MIRRLPQFSWFLALLACLVVPPVAAAAPKAAGGYVVSVALAGEDAAAILRSGTELVPKLMMPLYDGDIIDVRNRDSRLAIETAAGSIEIAGGQKPYELKGEIPTVKGATALLSAVAETLSEKLPAAKQEATALELAMAVKGPNFLVAGDRRLWLAWTGGTAPFKLIVEVDGRAKLYDGIRERDFTFDIPGKAGRRFEVVIKDADKHLVRTTFRMRELLPELPGTIAAAAPGQTTGLLLLAAWLTTRHEGDWTVEAAQLLRARGPGDQAAAALLERIVSGWKVEH